MANHPNADVITALIAAGPPTPPWKFCIVSDTRPDTDIRTINTVFATTTHTPAVPATDDVTGGILDQAIDCSPDFIIHLGDMVYSGRNDGGNEQWDYYLNVVDCLNVPYLISGVGNHELIHADGPANYAAKCGDYDNYFNYGGVRFIYMNDMYVAGSGDALNYARFTSEQITWLHTALTEGSCPDYVFIFLHIPVMRSGRLNFDLRSASWNRNALLLEDFLAEINDCGKFVTVSQHHWQFWERFLRGNVNFFTSAGGGEPVLLSANKVYDIEDPPWNFTYEHHFMVVTIENESMNMTWETIRYGAGTTANPAYKIQLR